MKIVFEETKYSFFAINSEYNKELVDFCRYLKGLYGWQNFFFKDKKWRFRDPSIIFMFYNKFPWITIEKEVTDFCEKMNKAQNDAIEIEKRSKKIKESVDSNIVIPGIKGDLYPYQKIGVEFFVNNKGRGILADSPGVGKTVQTLAYLLVSKKKKTIVVCPASVKFAWKSEVEKWTPLKPFIISSQTDTKKIPEEAEVVIINYDILKKHLKNLLRVKWECMICDESHLCKTPGRQRTEAVLVLSKKIESVIMVDGTPMLSRPAELFNILNIIDPFTWDNYYNYAVRYCDGKQGTYGFEAKGATNLAELSDRIGHYFLRRTKSQVLKDLPPILPTVKRPVELTGKYLKEYVKVSDEFIKYLKENKGKSRKEIKKSLQAEKLVRITYLRQISALGQVNAVKDHIDSIIENGEKVLVFCAFNEPLEALSEVFWDESVIITGKTDVEERGDLVKKFQTDPETKIFFGGFNSAGVGITLTAANNVILIGYPWTPADVEQIICRLHRPGQFAEKINIYQFYSMGTYDEYMETVLKKKEAILGQVIDSQNVKPEEMDEEGLIALLEEHDRIRGV